MKLTSLRTFCFLLFIICIHSSCSKDDESFMVEGYIPTMTEQYFLDVALNSEFGDESDGLRKWNSDLRIFIDHNDETELLTELDRIINEINDLSNSIELQIVNSRESANYIILFGTADEYASLEPNASPFVESNWGLTWIYWDRNNIINRGSMYVDVVRNTDPDCLKHILREELTQGLGLLNDTFDFPDSIFYQQWTCTTEYSEEDRMLISYLLDPNFEANMTLTEILEIFSMN